MTKNNDATRALKAIDTANIKIQDYGTLEVEMLTIKDLLEDG